MEYKAFVGGIPWTMDDAGLREREPPARPPRSWAAAMRPGRALPLPQPAGARAGRRT